VGKEEEVRRRRRWRRRRGGYKPQIVIGRLERDRIGKYHVFERLVVPIASDLVELLLSLVFAHVGRDLLRWQ